MRSFPLCLCMRSLWYSISWHWVRVQMWWETSRNDWFKMDFYFVFPRDSCKPISQIRSGIEIQDGRPLRNDIFYCFLNPRWRYLFSANQEPNWEFKMAAPMEGKVGHVGEQPTMASFNGELGSVSWISIATRIGQINTLEYTKYSENVRRSRDDYDTATIPSEKKQSLFEDRWSRRLIVKREILYGVIPCGVCMHSIPSLWDCSGIFIYCNESRSWLKMDTHDGILQYVLWK